MRLLYVSHTGVEGGAERSLLDLLAALPEGTTSVMACPEGPFCESVRRLGVQVFWMPAIDVGLSGKPVDLVRGAHRVMAAGRRMRHLIREARPDLVHANSVRSGLATLLFSRSGWPPTLVHVRDCLPPSPIVASMHRLILRRAALVVANSSYTARCFLPGEDSPNIRTVYNGIDLNRFDASAPGREQAREQLGLTSSRCVLGVVGQITPWKRQDAAIWVLERLVRRGRDAHLMLVGEAKFTAAGTRYDNRAYLFSLHELSRQLALTDRVSFLGERDDVPAVLRALDVLLVPSIQEPFGRVVIEAMAMRTPVIATSVGGPAELLEDHRTGRLLPPQPIEPWVDAVEWFLESRARRNHILEAARGVALGFGHREHAESMMRAYCEVLDRNRGLRPLGARPICRRPGNRRTLL